jgi:predicted transcriptional regulator with HTH domain
MGKKRKVQILKKNGKKYIKVNKKYYKVSNKLSDEYIVQNLFDIVKQLTKRNKKRQKKKISTLTEKNPVYPEATGQGLLELSPTEKAKEKEDNLLFKKTVMRNLIGLVPAPAIPHVAAVAAAALPAPPVRPALPAPPGFVPAPAPVRIPPPIPPKPTPKRSTTPPPTHASSSSTPSSVPPKAQAIIQTLKEQKSAVYNQKVLAQQGEQDALKKAELQRQQSEHFKKQTVDKHLLGMTKDDLKTLLKVTFNFQGQLNINKPDLINLVKAQKNYVDIVEGKYIKAKSKQEIQKEKFEQLNNKFEDTIDNAKIQTVTNLFHDISQLDELIDDAKKGKKDTSFFIQRIQPMVKEALTQKSADVRDILGEKYSKEFFDLLKKYKSSVQKPLEVLVPESPILVRKIDIIPQEQKTRMVTRNQDQKLSRINIVDQPSDKQKQEIFEAYDQAQQSTQKMRKELDEFEKRQEERKKEYQKSLQTNREELQKDELLMFNPPKKIIQTRPAKPTTKGISVVKPEQFTNLQIENAKERKKQLEQKLDETEDVDERIRLNEEIGRTDFLIQSMQEQKGEGRNGGAIGDDTGSWDYELEKIMKDYKPKGFKGVFSIDELNKIPIKKNESNISFIMNTEKRNVPHGHWVSILITPDNLEYFDSLADEPSKLFRKNIRKVLDQIYPNKSFQFKINRLKRQSEKSNNCGYFASKFLIDRYTGKNFKKASGFEDVTKAIKRSDVKNGERNIEKFKAKLKEFYEI